jgi:hypothetical protein
MNVDPGEIVCALENVPGVLGVYALSPREKLAEHIAAFVHIEDTSMRARAEAHYALLRYWRHEECARINLCATLPSRAALDPVEISESERRGLAARLAERARKLTEERAEEDKRANEAQAQAARQSPTENMLGPWWRSQGARRASVLIVDDGLDLSSAALLAFPDGDIVVASRISSAMAHLRARGFDLVICRSPWAFHGFGLLSEIRRAREKVQIDLAVFVVVDEDGLRVARDQASDYAGCWLAPVKPETMRAARESFYRGSVGGPREIRIKGPSVVIRPHQEAKRIRAHLARTSEAEISTAAAAAQAARAATLAKPALSRVLVVDDDDATKSLQREWSPSMHVIVTDDAFVALEKIAMDEAIDLVLCSATLRTAGDQLVYRLLWNSRPNIKARCALIYSPDTVPASVREGRSTTALPRPVTMDAIRDLMRARSKM